MSNAKPTSDLRKKLFVEETLWENVCTIAHQIFHDKDDQALKDLVGRCLLSLEDFRYAVREHDTDGNAIFRSSTVLLSLLGKQPGPLEWRGYYYPETDPRRAGIC